MSHRGLFKDYVGVFDSGVGGVSVWREIARQLPHEDIVYLADQAHVPYGFRPMEEIRTFDKEITRFLLEQGAKAIVIACNAASVAGLDYLRALYPDVPFVGMEPAVKPAAERTRTGVIAVIATHAAFQGERFASLVARYAGDAQVLTCVGVGLVEAVEAGALDTPETEVLLQKLLTPLIEAGADQIVLGCSHYPFLLPAIERIVGPDVAAVDPSPAVARQTARVLAKRGLEADRGRVGRYAFVTTGDADKFAVMVKDLIPTFWNETSETMGVCWQGERLKMTT
jgi:glutamate racemase